MCCTNAEMSSTIHDENKHRCERESESERNGECVELSEPWNKCKQKLSICDLIHTLLDHPDLFDEGIDGCWH